ADQVVVLVPTHTQVQSESFRKLPIVLEVEPQLLGAAGHIEVRIPRAGRHANHCSRSREALRVIGLVRRDHTRISSKVDFERGVRFEESAQLWVIDEVNSYSECMPPVGLGDIVLE